MQNTDTAQEKRENILTAGRKLHRELKELPDSQERVQAILKLREAVMWAEDCLKHRTTDATM